MTHADAAGTGALPVLYSFRRCPFAMRARLAIAASGQRCELREVVLRDKPAALIAASPKATVPVLVLPEGTVLAQSLDIMHWALHSHDPERWLPQSPAEQARVDALVAQCDVPFKQHLDRYKYPNRYLKPEEGAAAPTEADFAAVHRKRGAEFLAELDSTLSHSDATSPSLIGGRWSMADAAILPFVRQFAATDPAWFDAQPWPAVHAWLQAFVVSSRLAAVMDKYARWEDGRPGVAFPA